MKQSDLYHKWVEWSEQDQVYIGKCPDLISGIHHYFEKEGRILPHPRIRPMQDVA